MSYINFDRHSIFTSEINSEVLSLINEVGSYSYQTTGKFRTYRSIENKLYGLFDGFLYDTLLEECEVLSAELLGRIMIIVNHIKSSI